VIPREGVESVDLLSAKSSGDIVIPREGVERIGIMMQPRSILSRVIPREGVERVFFCWGSQG